MDRGVNLHISYWFIIGVIAVALIWTTLDGCSNKIKQAQGYEAKIAFLQKRDSANLNKIHTQANDSATMQQNLMSETIAKETLEKELKQFKRVSLFLEAKILNKVEDVLVGFNEPSTNDFDGLNFHKDEYLHRDTVSAHFLRIPKTFSYSDKWASISGTTTKGGNAFDIISVTDEFDAIIGRKKQKGLFKRAKPVLELKSYSPYSTISYVNNITVTDDRSGMNRLLTSKGAFFAYGFLANTATSKLF